MHEIWKRKSQMDNICSWEGCIKIWLSSPAMHFKLKMEFFVLHPVFILAQIVLSEIQIFKASCVLYRKPCGSYVLQQHRVKFGISELKCFKFRYWKSLCLLSCSKELASIVLCPQGSQNCLYRDNLATQYSHGKSHSMEKINSWSLLRS